jgi:LuxR family transcriptional regulator, regulator of acetate metabolism
VIAEGSSARQRDERETERVIVELLALERELCELEYVRRADALERVTDAVRRLSELAGAEGIIGRAAAELGASSQFDRVLIGEVTGDRLLPLALWDAAGESMTSDLEALQQETIPLAYPLIELEVVHRRSAELVDVRAGGQRAPAELTRTLGLSSYVVAPILAQGETIGLLHADAAESGRELDGVDLEVAAEFAAGLSGVLERAVLRHTLDLHRAELEAAAQWMGTRLNQLAEGSKLGGAQPGSDAGRRMIDSLTTRELEVVRLLGRGQTNLEIADTLVVREGTVKYHVKNILRKLGATSRADAVSRFVRSSAQEDGT